MERGRLIALEGPDGSGKTTQIQLLEEYLKELGYEVVRTREPGGTEISEKIREIILDNDNCNMSYMCEALLYAASRAQLVNEVIKPALNKGKIVICDRFVYSSMVYQGVGRGLGMDRIKSINEAALDGLEADLVCMITIPYEEGLKRKKMQKNGCKGELNASSPEVRSCLPMLSSLSTTLLKPPSSSRSPSELERALCETKTRVYLDQN